MVRKPTPERRDKLEAKIVDYVLAHGIADLSLRPLAEALGVSTYALIYHFGTKEGVVAAAVAGIEERQRAMIPEVSQQVGARPADLLRRYWYDWCLNDTLLPYHRLFYEVYGLALQHPERYPGFLERGAWGPWLATVHALLLGSGLPEADAETVATLMLATIGGALLGVLTTGDARAPTRAVEMVATLIERTIAEAGTA